MTGRPADLATVTKTKTWHKDGNKNLLSPFRNSFPFSFCLNVHVLRLAEDDDDHIADHDDAAAAAAVENWSCHAQTVARLKQSFRIGHIMSVISTKNCLFRSLSAFIFILSLSLSYLISLFHYYFPLYILPMFNHISASTLHMYVHFKA